MSSVCVILCRPQLDLNIGACARVMSNMDFNDLRIVNPKDPNIIENAYTSASHATEILDNARLYKDIESAIADLSFVVMTSARPRDMEKETCSLKKLPSKLENKGKIGVVFGPERTGLTNQELALADILIQIPAGKNKSYNLSHATAIVLHEIFSSKISIEPSVINNLASKKEINLFLEYVIKTLEEKKYFEDTNKKSGQSLNLKNLLTRNYITKQDIKTLYGIVNTLKKQ